MDYSNHSCPVCKKVFEKGDDIVVCPLCGAPHHRECYEVENRCFFEDKHKESVNYFCPSEFFAEYFQLIKKLVPSCEDVPEVLKTKEDFEEE